MTEDITPIVDSWLHEPVSLTESGKAKVARLIRQTPQQRSWFPLPALRFPSMFNATKFVVAGVIVALFGGFLLSGVLTQPSDDRLPAVGASASATTQAEPTEAATSEPTTEAEADSTTTTPDLLPGVDLVTEEVEAGVYRVLSDGLNELAENIWHVAATADGDLWVERHGTEHLPATESTSEDIRSVDSRVFRLGHAEEFVLSRYPDLETENQEVGLSVTRDGIVVAGDQDPSQGALAFDGEEWTSWEGCLDAATYGGFTGPDSSCWFVPPTSEVVRELPGKDPDADDRYRVYTLDELDMVPSTSGLGWEPMPFVQLAQSDDGTIWAAGDVPGTTEAQFAAFDSESWLSIPSMEPVDGLSPTSLEDVHLAVAGGPGASVWVSHWDRAELELYAWYWDGDRWTTYGPIVTHEGPALPMDAWPIPWSGIHVGDGGLVWLDGLVRFDGEPFEAFDVPASATSVEPEISSISHGLDGSLWLTVSGGLYVITPEAVAASE